MPTFLPMLPTTEILHDRSRATTDWRCRRRRFWNYEWNGRGLSPASTQLELFLGTTVHDALAAIATTHQGGAVLDIDALAEAAREQTTRGLASFLDDPDGQTFILEQSALVEGMVRGFHQHVWPRLMAQFPRILAIEQEMLYPHHGMTFMAKPDLVAEGPEGAVYVEYKTTSSKNDKWINSWGTAVQLHSTVRAIEHTLGVKPYGVVVQGLYKGFESYGKQSSPFCYCYRRQGNPPFTKDEITYEYRPGLKRFPTWELPGGVKAWVEHMPENILADQFPSTPIIFINDTLVDAFFEQQATREQEIAMAKALADASPEAAQSILDVAFPQNFEACAPGWGPSCPYKPLCFAPVGDPLSAGFVLREPHHQPEIDAQKAEEQAS